MLFLLGSSQKDPFTSMRKCVGTFDWYCTFIYIQQVYLTDLVDRMVTSTPQVTG